MSSAVILIAVLLVCMLTGIPVAWSLILSCTSAVILEGMPLATVAQRVFAGMDSFPILAIPAFLVAGEVMGQGSISSRLINLADALVGRIAGGVSMISIVASSFFAALTGSGVATTAAIGGLMYPEMVKRNYRPDYAAAIQAIGGTLGPVIPPSIIFIFYGNSTGISVTALLMSGVIPGILASVALCLVAYGIAKKNHFKSEGRFSSRKVWTAFQESIFALLMPVIILGGIYMGIFTATESAGVAAIYGILVSVFVYQEMDLKKLVEIFKKCAVQTANLLILIASAQMFGWMVSYFNIPSLVAQGMMSVVTTKLQFMLFSFLIFVVTGMFMDAAPAAVILPPILAPLAAQFGVDPIHYGLFMVYLLCVGLATPPFGPTLFVAASIIKQPMMRIARQLLPFIGIMLLMGLVYMCIPQLATWLPSIMK